MKRVLTLTVLVCVLFLTACNSASIGIIGGADGPTAIFITENKGESKGKFGEQYEKTSIRMFNADGDLYYDSGLVSENTLRCGTLDGELKRAVKYNEIPFEAGVANFDADGYQNATSITKEVNIDGEWVIFKKYDTYGRSLEGLKYCYYIKGRLNNAAIDSEIVVLTDNEDVAFSDVYEPLLSSRLPIDEGGGKTIYNFISRDKWGLALYADAVTNKGLTIKFEQFGGNCSGALQTGARYKLETIVDDQWHGVKEKVENTVWNSIAYAIKKNDIIEQEINWEFLYGELQTGYYRLSKEIMDFRKPGDYDTEIYYVWFTIE